MMPAARGPDWRVALALAAGLWGSAAYANSDEDCHVTVRDHRDGQLIEREVPCRTVAGPAPRPSISGGVRPTINVRPTDPADTVALLNLVHTGASLPERLPIKSFDKGTGAAKSAILVTAETLRLGSGRYRVADGSAPRNVILVANRIEIAGLVEFDLSGRALDTNTGFGFDLNDRSGGDLMILANEIACESGGQLTLVAHGARGHRKVNFRGNTNRPASYFRRFGGGHGGDLIIGAAKAILGAEASDGPESAMTCIQADLTPGQPGQTPLPGGTRGQILVFPSMEAAVRNVEARASRPPGFARGLRPAAAWGRHATSKWILEMLKKSAADMQLAALSNNRRQVYQLLIRVATLTASPPPRLDTDHAAFVAALDQLLTLRNDFALGLWAEERRVMTTGSLPRNIQLFTDGDTLETWAAPTDALIRTLDIGGEPKLGLIQFGSGEDRLVQIEMEFDLRVDPMIAAALTEELSSQDETFSGAFIGWRLTPRPILGNGIRSSEITIQPGDRSGRISLNLLPDAIGLVLARLAGRNGLTLAFDWRYRKNESISGFWEGVPLSAQRQAQSPVLTTPEGAVRSLADFALAIEYAELAGSQFTTFNPAILVPAGGAVERLPIPQGSVLASIPPEAIAFSGLDLFKLQSQFHIVNGDEWVDRVEIINLLGFNDAIGAQLERVEIEVNYTSGDQVLASGPVSLAPVGAQGDRLVLTFLHQPGAGRAIEITGNAHYVGGSRESFGPIQTDDLSIKISDALLP